MSNGARLSVLSKAIVDLCLFRPIGPRKEINSLQVQARAANTASNCLVIRIVITGIRKKIP